MKALRLVNRCESHQPGDIAVSLITNRLLTDVSWTKSERKKDKPVKKQRQKGVNCEKKTGENRGNHRKKGENIGKQRKT